MLKNETRQHYYLNKPVIFAPNRSKRPVQNSSKESLLPTLHKNCQFCNNLEPALYSINDEAGWIVKSVANIYSALQDDYPLAYGYQEVVLEDPEHIVNLGSLGSAKLRALFRLYQQRITCLKNKKDIKYVSVIKNHSKYAGATIDHTHSEIYALPYTPPSVAYEIEQLKKYWRTHKNCAVCDVVSSEIKDNERVFYKTDECIALSPYASEYPYEAWIIPTKHVSSFIQVSPYARSDMASALWCVLSYLEEHNFGYNFYINDLHDSIGHTYIRVVSRSKPPNVSAGFELASEVTINTVLPEKATLLYQDYVHSRLPAQRFSTLK